MARGCLTPFLSVRSVNPFIQFSRFLISSDSARPVPVPLLEAGLTELTTEGIAEVTITVEDKSEVCLAVEDVGVVLGEAV